MLMKKKRFMIINIKLTQWQIQEQHWLMLKSSPSQDQSQPRPWGPGEGIGGREGLMAEAVSVVQGAVMVEYTEMGIKV